MRNVVLALFTALVFLLGACSTSTPQPAVCVTNDSSCDGSDDGGTDNGGTTTPTDNSGSDDDNGTDDGGDHGGDDNGGDDHSGGDNGGDDNGGDDNGTDQPAPFSHSLMKGFVDGYKGDKVLTVKSLWIDQSTGEVIDLGTDPMARLEKDGEFGVRLGKPDAAALATLPLPLECGTLKTTTVPAGLTEVKGAIVPALFVFDGDQLVGLIIHGSYHVDKNGNIVPKAKLAMRVYSAADKIISQGECAGTLEANALALNYEAIVDGLASLGVSSPELNNILGDLAVLGSPAVNVNLTVDVGLKKGWNTVVLSAELENLSMMRTAVAEEPVEPAAPTLNVKLADDTEPNFTYYYLDLTQFATAK
jgi:hypothetical protein